MTEETVTVPLASAPGNMNQPGKLVAAPVAPSSGPIPAENAVVGVKDWFRSSTIWASIAGVLYAGMDAAFTVLMPVLQSSDPIDFKTLPTRLIRPFLIAVGFAFFGFRRKSDNSVIR